MLAVREQLYTIEEFHEIVALSENEDRRLELDDGVIVDIGSSSKVNTITAIRIAIRLGNFVEPRNLGYITGSDGGYKVGPRKVRRPDVGFISIARAGSLEGVDFEDAPDLAVEVVSPDEDILKKAHDYFRAGCKLVWAFYTDDQRVFVMKMDEDGSLISTPVERDGTLDGGDVLPGFTLALRDMFI
jgi:Uma2 family endonuclease